jgi:hypothetical protein
MFVWPFPIIISIYIAKGKAFWIKITRRKKRTLEIKSPVRYFYCPMLEIFIYKLTWKECQKHKDSTDNHIVSVIPFISTSDPNCTFWAKCLWRIHTEDTAIGRPSQIENLFLSWGLSWNKRALYFGNAEIKVHLRVLMYLKFERWEGERIDLEEKWKFL